MPAAKETGIGCAGYCPRCGRKHGLDGAAVRPAARALMRFFDDHGHVDLTGPDNAPDDRTTTAPLFGSERGKMFGVLLCRDVQGKTKILYGFSGMLNGHWRVPGWVGPLFNVDTFHHLVDPVERSIKELGRRMDGEQQNKTAWMRLRTRRRDISRQLMQRIFALYRLPDFRGRCHTLAQAFHGNGGIPTGTGDCCAPKLLAHAARHRLVPVSLAEFYYGRENASATRMHKHFYPACEEKCAPILGTMLCGIGEIVAQDTI